MKSRFNSYGNLPVKQELEIHNVVIIIISVFQDNNTLSTSTFRWMFA